MAVIYGSWNFYLHSENRMLRSQIWSDCICSVCHLCHLYTLKRKCATSFWQLSDNDEVVLFWINVQVYPLFWSTYLLKRVALRSHFNYTNYFQNHFLWFTKIFIRTVSKVTKRWSHTCSSKIKAKQKQQQKQQQQKQNGPRIKGETDNYKISNRDPIINMKEHVRQFFVIWIRL